MFALVLHNSRVFARPRMLLVHVVLATKRKGELVALLSRLYEHESKREEICESLIWRVKIIKAAATRKADRRWDVSFGVLWICAFAGDDGFSPLLDFNTQSPSSFAS